MRECFASCPELKLFTCFNLAEETAQLFPRLFDFDSLRESRGELPLSDGDLDKLIDLARERLPSIACRVSVVIN